MKEICNFNFNVKLFWLQNFPSKNWFIRKNETVTTVFIKSILNNYLFKKKKIAKINTKFYDALSNYPNI